MKTKTLDLLKIDKSAYSYILGIYLGDGCINKMPRTYKLRIFLDAKYMTIIDEVEQNLRILFPKNKINQQKLYHKGKLSSITVYLYSNNLPLLFPQHGVGKKHQRLIKLELWQEKIMVPEKLLRGLFHSDGCYYNQTVNNKYTYSYYDFANFSMDILNIWKKYADELKISYIEVKNHIRHRSNSSYKKLYPILGIKK